MRLMQELFCLLVCVAVIESSRSCRNPNNIPHGSFSPRRGHYPESIVITYKCEDGYTLLGTNQRTCHGDGSWSGSEPRCSRPDECQKRNYHTCHIHADCVRISDRKYMCKCRDDYKGDGVYCEGKGCEMPPGIANGKLLTHQRNFVRGNVVTYKCDRGYRLAGNAQRSCLNDGRWSGNDPRCEQLPQTPIKKPCQRPQDIQHGSVRVSDGSLRSGSTITYECIRPYRLEGNSQRTCQDDGNWTGWEPQCKRYRRYQGRRCQRPQNIAHGYFTTSDMTYRPKTVITYQCRHPHQMVGNTQRTCLANGQWAGTVPKCEDKDGRVQKRCQRPPENIAHGRTEISNQQLTVGTVVTFSCERGWRLEGNSQRTCQQDGRWSGNQPRCRHK